MIQLLMNSLSDAETASAEVCKVAIIGFGTVGSSVAKILSERAPAGLRLTHICNRTLARKQQAEWLPTHVKWTEDINEVLASDVDVVVEVIGGLAPAGDWVRSALNSGKSVVTANKQLIAHYGPELIALARKQKRHLAFGASVAGGIPVISGLQEGLAGDELFKIYGILNGTCNYILSQIESAGIPFSTALAEAQRLGFAEADPTDDIDGLDARAKLAILARVGLRSQTHPNDILCRSISSIEAVDFDYAKQLGCTIRQISWAELEGSGEKAPHLLASVQPALVGLSSPLARVQGAQNLVMSTGRFGGETVFGGHGAGGNPTAVAIVSDIAGIAKAQQGMPFEFEMAATPRSVTADFTTRHYLRFTVKDRPGIIATLASIFSDCDINIDSVLQKPGYLKSSLPFVITLETCKASLVEKARTLIASLDFLAQPCVYLPILN
ncbi:MAG TPA: homoserine dehydrogenase [Terriglobales bacterium]|nr:homoserine dehydrogenase [Terriglobales bacterium]